MKLLSQTLSTCQANLALDEALLDWLDGIEGADSQPEKDPEFNAARTEVLRLWEVQPQIVVIGRGSQIAQEVNVQRCELESIPVLRRCSGGTAVVIGEGCLIYSLLLDLRLRPQLRMVDEAHREVMTRMQQAIATYLPEVQFQGTCDLTWQDRKFSGNSLRCKRDAILYHGTLLYRFPLERLDELLGTPPRQPDYRRSRKHSDFVTNLPLTKDQLINSLATVWEVEGDLPQLPLVRVENLLSSKYNLASWHAGHARPSIPSMS